MQVIGITTKIVKVRKEKEEQSCNTNKEDINNYLESKRCLSILKIAMKNRGLRKEEIKK